MEDLDAALNELGMLSNVTNCRLEYIQDIEAAAEARKAAALKAASTANNDVTISVNSNFVTNISISSKYTDFSPSMRRKLELEIKEKRLSGGHICDKRHSCPSSHICSFVSPRRNRIVTRTSPYSSSRIPPVSLRPAALPGVLISSRTRSLGRLRGPVRFYEPLEGSPPQGVRPSIYPLDEELTSRLSAIQLGNLGDAKRSLDYSVESSSNSNDSNDLTSELSWNVSRLELEQGSSGSARGHS